MSDGQASKKNKFFERLKNVKHIEIYIAVIFGIILVLIYMSSLNTTKSKSSTSDYDKDVSITQYIDKMESDLEDILGNINGVSKVKVMISIETDDLTVTDNVISSKSFPKIKGVIIVADGVSNTATKLNVLKAVQAVIDITSGGIEILQS